MRSESKIAGAGIFTALAASLCCITPVLALFAGMSGIASTFSWLDPLRPYLIGLTVLVLGFAWYQKLKPRTKEEIECACNSAHSAGREGEKPKFIQSRTFLGMVTVFAVLMLTFPLYADVFYPQNDKQAMVVDRSDIQSVEFKISGMTCTGCEALVKHELNKLEGIIEVLVSYEKRNAIVKYDQSKTNAEEIEKAINSTGYKVINQEQTN